MSLLDWFKTPPVIEEPKVPKYYESEHYVMDGNRISLPYEEVLPYLEKQLGNGLRFLSIMDHTFLLYEKIEPVKEDK